MATAISEKAAQGVPLLSAACIGKRMLGPWRRAPYVSQVGRHKYGEPCTRSGSSHVTSRTAGCPAGSCCSAEHQPPSHQPGAMLDQVGSERVRRWIASFVRRPRW